MRIPGLAWIRRRRLAGLGLLASGLVAACNQLPVLPVDQFAGEPVEFWATPSVQNLPVFVTAPAELDACDPSPGPCETVCTSAPGTCAPNSCRALAIDSLTQLSTFLSPILSEPTYGPSCAQLRSPPKADAGGTHLRLRIHELGTLILPESSAVPERWTLDDGRGLAGVLGGDFLLQFAAELTFPAQGPARARFMRRLPGGPARLENRGLSYLAAQSPGQFLGRVPGDQCELAPGLPCDRPIAQLGNLETQKIMPPSRLQLDVCVAPPPCTLRRGSDGSCSLGESLGISSQAGGRQGCSEWKGDGSDATGASLLLATAVSGIVLFSDSAQRIIPDPSRAPDCSRVVHAPPGEPGLAFCKEPVAQGTLRLPGWPALTGLPQYKVSSLAVLSGEKSQHSAHPCDRWQQRMRALEHQCQAFQKNSYFHYPTQAVESAPQLGVSLTYPMFQTGALAKSSDETLPPTHGWLPVTVVPSSSPQVRNLRRSSGTIAAQADGLLGMAAFAQSRVYLDFTERERSPGIRVQCLEPQLGLCRSIPPCAQQGAAGSASCCFGLPQKELLAAIRATPESARPHPCCPALSQSTREALAAQSPGLCD